MLKGSITDNEETGVPFHLCVPELLYNLLLPVLFRPPNILKGGNCCLTKK